MQKINYLIIHLDGMICNGCEVKVTNMLKDLNGIKSVTSSYKNNCTSIEYDTNFISIDTIKEVFKESEYSILKVDYVDKKTYEKSLIKENNKLIVLGLTTAIVLFFIIVYNTIGFNFIPDLNEKMSYGILFTIGLLTSLHCISMCGGINAAVCMNFNKSSTGKKNYKASFMYNLGRVLSYSIIGGIVGGIGSIVGFTGSLKGLIAILSGVFMIILGIKLLNVIPVFKKINIRMPNLIGNKLYKNLGHRGPLYVGLLNGFMPCGPLQAMQLYALGTGSIIAGSLSMMFFSLGTFPLMFLLGVITSILNKNFTKQLIRVSAVFVIILGFIMINRGTSLAGYNLNFIENKVVATDNSSLNIAQVNGGIQEVEMNLTNGDYYPIVVQKDIPVRWKIIAKESELNGCNNPLTIPEYKINQKLSVGDNFIEFTPSKKGNIVYTCWMGMITSNIKVVDNINSIDINNIEKEQNEFKENTTGSGCSCCTG